MTKKTYHKPALKSIILMADQLMAAVSGGLRTVYGEANPSNPVLGNGKRNNNWEKDWEKDW